MCLHHNVFVLCAAYFSFPHRQTGTQFEVEHCSVVISRDEAVGHTVDCGDPDRLGTRGFTARHDLCFVESFLHVYIDRVSWLLAFALSNVSSLAHPIACFSVVIVASLRPLPRRTLNNTRSRMRILCFSAVPR